MEWVSALQYGALGAAMTLFAWTMKINTDRYKRSDEVTDRLIDTASANAAANAQVAAALADVRTEVARLGATVEEKLRGGSPS